MKVRKGVKKITWGHPLGHWSTEKTLSAPVFIPVISAAQVHLQSRFNPAFSFLLIPHPPRRPLPGEAIRSVTHLVLAPWSQFFWTQFSDRKERAGIAPGPGSLRPGFLGHRSFTPAAPFLASRVRTGSAPKGGYPALQKTFSAGPCSFSSKEFWFPGSLAASGVQPVLDSRHGRITCKILSATLVK